ncbi:MAG: HAD-IA family hydrolase [Kiritimatiellae bacterium]|nr:HAD-IA family hydrolase [Kiritimatiellia bacterium]
MTLSDPVQRRVDAVLFDMDGVLCDSEPFICEAARLMFRERYGLEFSPDEFRPFVGAGEDRYLGGPAERRGLRLNLPADKARTYEIYLQIIRGRLAPLPGAVEFVRAARTLGLRTAVATSADRIKLEGNLREIGLAEGEFDARITGDDIRRKKPDPEIFLAAAAALRVAPSRCLVVEDAPNGLRAGVAAGARCLGILSSFPEAELRAAGARWLARDLAEALPRLPQMIRED